MTASTSAIEHARATRTAMEGHEEQRGVCRDFAHLAITLCRCMNIPARYCTGYLGDIGIPASDAPMDFSAWFEVYLDGRWFTLRRPPQHPAQRPERHGPRPRRHRRAAISTTFGVTQLTLFTVITDEVEVETPTPAMRSARG